MMIQFTNWIKAFFYAHVTIYYRHYRYSKYIDIRNSNETLDYIISNRVSVSRFGDGEIDVIAGRGNGMQTPNSVLGERLKEVLQAHVNNHIVCLPYGWKSKKGLIKRNKLWWTWFVADNYKLLINDIDSERTYYNTNFTRFYMDIADKHSETMKKYVERFRKIWENRDVCLVEGERTRFGVGNDFLGLLGTNYIDGNY